MYETFENIKYNMPTLVEILKARIGKGGKSKTSVAAHLGVSERTIENYMKGTRQPKPEVLVQLANFLGFSLSELGVQNVQIGSEIQEPMMQYKMNGSHADYTAEYIQLLKDQLKTTQERLRFQEHLETLQSELKKNRALLTTVLEHMAKVRASIEKKPLEKIQSEMGSSFFSALGLNDKKI